MKKRAIKIVLATIVTVFSVLIVAGVVARIVRAAAPPTASPQAAFSACQEFARERLRAPRTATFGDYSDATIRGGSEGEYDIAGTVDAQNEMGVPMRHDFACTVRYETVGHSFGLVNIKVTAR